VVLKEITPKITMKSNLLMIGIVIIVIIMAAVVLLSTPKESIPLENMKYCESDDDCILISDCWGGPAICENIENINNYTKEDESYVSEDCERLRLISDVSLWTYEIGPIVGRNAECLCDGGLCNMEIDRSSACDEICDYLVSLDCSYPEYDYKEIEEFCSNQTCECFDSNKSYLEIHEWGVLAGCEQSSDYFVTSRPEIMVAVDLPIVYVHSEGIDKFSAEFSILNGELTNTYPYTPVRRNMVAWYDVMLNPPVVDEEVDALNMPRVPLEDLMPMLNDVDADTLYYGGEETKFLFYEGNMSFQNMLEVSFNPDETEITVTNEGTKRAHNVIISGFRGDFLNGSYYFAVIGDLEADGETTADFRMCPYNSDFDPGDLVKSDLGSMGFTEKEIDAFLNIWSAPMFYTTNMPYTNLIYRLPHEEYDEMLPADVNPEPDKFVRAMYVLVDLSE
jgi:hypothetical protein